MYSLLTSYNIIKIGRPWSHFIDWLLSQITEWIISALFRSLTAFYKISFTFQFYVPIEMVSNLIKFEHMLNAVWNYIKSTS